MSRTAYLAGPMTGIPKLNFPAFMQAAIELRRMGWVIENPAEYDIAAGIDPDAEEKDQPKSRAELLKEDFLLILNKCDGIFLLPGWRESEGAKAEFTLARLSGLFACELRYNYAGELLIDKVTGSSKINVDDVLALEGVYYVQP